MSGPWEDYQSAPSDGPWKDYAQKLGSGPEPLTWAERNIAPLLPNLLSPKDESRYRGVLIGASNPVMGAAQGIAHAFGGGSSIDPMLADKNAQYEADRAAVGRSGFDAAKAVGSMISPASAGAMKVVPFLSGAAGILPKAGQYLGNVAIGGATGATLNALDPANQMPGQSYEDAKIQQAKSGAVGGMIAGGVAAPILSAAAKGAGWAVDLLKGRGADVKAATIARAAAGNDLPAIRAATANAVPGDTAAQAASSVNSDAFSALGDLARRNDATSAYSRIAAMQEANRLATLQGVASGANQTEARTVRDASKSALNQITTPMRETELNAANAGAQYGIPLQNEANSLGDLAASKVQDVRRMIGKDGLEGKAYSSFGTANPRSDQLANRAENVAQQAADESLIIGQGAQFAQARADSLAAHGLTPLDSGKITSALQAKINDPTIGPNEFNRKALSNVGQLVQEWEAKNGGVIDAKALYEIRKSAVNNIVEQQMAGAEPRAIAKRQAEVMSQVRPLIDDAIEQAGGTGWRDYLKTFSDGMQAINQKKMGATALDLYQKSPETLISLARGNEPKLVEKNFGPGQYNFSQEMGTSAQPIINVADELSRNSQLAESAARGAGGLAGIIKENTSGFRIPNSMNHTVTLTNDALAAMGSRLNRATMDRLVEGMKSGQSANELLKIIPTSQQQNFLKILMDSAGGRSALVAGSAAIQ